MKFGQKLFSCFLVVCLFMSNMIYCTPRTVYATESAADSVTLEDVLAGVADLSQLNETTTRAIAATPLFENGIYYINNKHCGDYLRLVSSSPIASSGRLSSLGTSVQWKITNVNNKITIQPQNDTSKYLAVPTSGTPISAVQLITVNSSTIPTECLWNVSVGEGGCILQNAYNSRYLYTYGTSGTNLFTSDSLGSSGTSTYMSRVWRIGSLSYISGKELSQSSDFETLVLAIGGSGSPSMSKAPSNAIWATASDFNYSRQVTSHVTESNGVFSGNTSGVTTVIATHKVTDLQFVFSVVVGSQPTYTVRNYIDQGYQVRFGGSTGPVTYNSVVVNKFEQFFALNTTPQFTSHTSSADTCKINQFGGVTSNNLTSSCPHSIEHLTRTALRDSMGNGTITNTRVVWTGHILPGNPASDSDYFARYSVVITPKHTTTGNNYTNKSDSEIRKESIYTLMHELSHQLDAPDHYCYGRDPNTGVCINPDCDTCQGGMTVARSCMMTYRYDIEEKSESTLYCSSCLADINNHLSGHHQ